jgi:hypothetical protein
MALRRLTWYDGETLKVGDKLGFDNQSEFDKHCAAEVTITEVGMAGCWVKIDKIIEKGASCNLKEGDLFGAGWSQLLTEEIR